MTEPTPIEVGQVWEHKGNRLRTVKIDAVYPLDECVLPRRNTSRRRQTISFKTLRREYRLRANG